MLAKSLKSFCNSLDKKNVRKLVIIIQLAGKDSQTSHSQVFTTEPKTFSGSTKMTLKKRNQKINTDFVFCSGTFIVH